MDLVVTPRLLLESLLCEVTELSRLKSFAPLLLRLCARRSRNTSLLMLMSIGLIGRLSCLLLVMTTAPTLRPPP